MTKPQSSAKKPASSSPFEVDRKLLTNMVSRVNDPVVARIFLCTLNMYPELKLQFLGAYLTAEETLERAQIRYDKAHNLGLAAARFKRLTLKLLSTSWSLSLAFARLVRKAFDEHKQHKSPPSVKPQAPSANVILLPLSRKATGTDN